MHAGCHLDALEGVCVREEERRHIQTLTETEREREKTYTNFD
jgi:hypothetical protein